MLQHHRMSIKYANTSSVTVLDQQTVQFKSFCAKEQRMKSAVRGQLHYSSPNPQQKWLPFHRLTCKVLEQQWKQALWLKKRFKNKTAKNQTTNRHWRNRFCQFSIFSICFQVTLGGFFKLWPSQLAGRKDVKFAHFGNKGKELQLYCMTREVPEFRPSTLASIPGSQGWG